MLALVNAVRMLYFNFINMAKESFYLIETFSLFFSEQAHPFSSLVQFSVQFYWQCKQKLLGENEVLEQKRVFY